MLQSWDDSGCITSPMLYNQLHASKMKPISACTALKRTTHCWFWFGLWQSEILCTPPAAQGQSSAVGSTAYLESDNSPPIKKERKFFVNMWMWTASRNIVKEKEGFGKKDKRGTQIWFLVVLNIFPHKTANTLCENRLMLPGIYLIMVVWKAIVPYPDSEVRGQQAVPQSQITAEVLRNQSKQKENRLSL